MTFVFNVLLCVSLALARSTWTLTASEASPDIYVCVNAAQYPSWAGHIDFGECEYAIRHLGTFVSPYQKETYTFFSRVFLQALPANGWETPYGYVDGNCVALVMVTKEFGNGTLPLGQGLPVDTLGPAEKGVWQTIIRSLQNLFSTCVASQEQPGWSTAGQNLTVLIVPNNSAFRRKWLNMDILQIHTKPLFNRTDLTRFVSGFS